MNSNAQVTVWDLILGAYCGEINNLQRHLEVSVKDDKNVQLTALLCTQILCHFFLLRIVLVHASALILMKLESFSKLVFKRD